MLTMQPSVTIGSYTWAQDRLPFDEFAPRIAHLRATMEHNGWPAVLVYGDVRDHGALAYLSNFIPRVRWGMALLPRNGDPRLICAMSTRDLPAMRTLTWIADVRSGMGPEWEKSFDPWLQQLRADRTAELATLGFDLMAPALRDAVARSLAGRFTLRRIDEVLAVPPTRKRPRELTLMRASCKLLDTAAKVFVDSWRQNGEPETAALDAERTARLLAAQDMRTLVSLDGGRTLVPFQGRFDKVPGPWAAYLAVKVMGYWADMFITVNNGDSDVSKSTEAALDTLIAAAQPGARASKLFAKATDVLKSFRLHPVLGGSVGHGIGLSLHEGAEFRAAEDTTLVADAVYALQAGIADRDAGNALLSAIVRCTAKGAEVLLRSPPITQA